MDKSIARILPCHAVGELSNLLLNDIQAVIACIANTIAGSIGLTGVRNVIAVVTRIAHFVAVAVRLRLLTLPCVSFLL